MPPVDIQLALQGGGAKLFALIAALEEFHNNQEKIRITRIAGTSAGAIVGSLYAAEVDPLTMRTQFAKLRLEGILGQDRPPGFLAQLRLLGQALNGHPLASDRVISVLLEDLLAQRLNLGRRACLEDLRIPILLVAADVSQRQPIIYDSTDPKDKKRDVVACVMDSCAIPFFFRGPCKSSQTLILDGGLVENLPTGLLSSEVKKYGRVVAVSFSDTTRATPQKALSLAAALLDTAINSSVASAKTISNISVIELNPYGVGTFDFHKAQAILNNSSSSEYENARLKTRDSISELTSSKGRVVSNTRWESSDPVTMDQLLKIYSQQQAPRTFKHFTVRLRVVLNSLLQEGEEDFGKSDVVEKTLEFAPSGESIDSLFEGINIDEGQKPSNVYTEILDDQDKPVLFEPIPVKAINKATFGLLLFFTPSLAPGSPARTYRIQTVFRVQRLFPGLLVPDPKEPETMAQRVPRADGPADRVELILCVPSSFRQLSVRPMPESPAVESIPWKELPPGPGQFKVFGWRARAVSRGARVGIEMN
jgi:predicted acylesterase/phospholipase RssA